MKKMIHSKYGYPIKHVIRDGSELTLKPGMNYVEEVLWGRVKTEKPRLQAQIKNEYIKDEGYLADWLIANADEVDARVVNSLSPDGARRIKKKATDDVIAILSAKAERGGIRRALEAGGGK
jgi:hypothetical protein